MSPDRTGSQSDPPHALVPLHRSRYAVGFARDRRGDLAAALRTFTMLAVALVGVVATLAGLFATSAKVERLLGW